MTQEHLENAMMAMLEAEQKLNETRIEIRALGEQRRSKQFMDLELEAQIRIQKDKNIKNIFAHRNAIEEYLMAKNAML